MMEPITIAITMGDPSGVGPYVIVQALKGLKEKGFLNKIRPIIFGDAGLFNDINKELSCNLSCAFISPPPWPSLPPLIPGQIGFCSVIELPQEYRKPGSPSIQGGKAQIAYVDQAIVAYQSGGVEAIVTAPINKKLVSQSLGKNFLGHTGYLAEKFGFSSDQGVMLFIGNIMKVALVTTHVPLKEVSSIISEDRIFNVIRTVVMSLKEDFGLESGRVIVLGLNPHAGEDGLIGEEEKNIILPAVERGIKWSKREKLNIEITGPVTPDRGIRDVVLGKMDIAIAMYHDQGLLPCKVLDFGRTVNYTAGLPVIRTSVDHGVGYDVVNNRDQINSDSMQEAIKLAAYIANRKRIRK